MTKSCEGAVVAQLRGRGRILVRGENADLVNNATVMRLIRFS